MGRLVDAVASLAGVCHVAGYAGQAATELQALAEQALRQRADAEPGAYPLPLRRAGGGSGPLEWDARRWSAPSSTTSAARVPAPVVGAPVPPRGRGRRGPRARCTPGARYGLDVVALTGSVFADALLLSLTARGLREAGLRVLRHRRVPPNDGGLALGQVAVGALRRPGRASSERERTVVSPGAARPSTRSGCAVHRAAYALWAVTSTPSARAPPADPAVRDLDEHAGVGAGAPRDVAAPRLLDPRHPRRLRARRRRPARSSPPIYATSTYKQDGVGGLRTGWARLRVQPQRQPDPHRARGVPRRARGPGAPAALRLRLGPGRRGHPAAVRAAAPATTSSSRTTPTAAPTG